MTEKIDALYVDDEVDLLNLGKIFLEHLGDFRVTIIAQPTEAIDLINKQSFDAIISDYQMPVINGIEFLRKIRTSGNSIPFILFTGKGREEVVIQALNEGADFYIQKGGDPRSQFIELSHKIRQAVQRRRLEVSVRDHERREADIINFLPDPTFAINTDGIVIAWNRAMETLSGISSRDILGKGNYEYALPFYHERRPMLINLVFGDDPETRLKYPWIKQEGNLLSAEITISHFHEGTGASFWFTASPLFDNQGTIFGAIESIREITESKRVLEALQLDESRLEALLKLHLMIGESEQDITQFALDEAVRLTESTVGYIAFVNDDESVLTMYAWSKRAMQECQILEKPLTNQVVSTGLWGESIRQRKPIITNDYNEENLLKKGIPKGHVPLTRHLSVPVFDGEHIVVIAGVGNKDRNYSASDIRQLDLLMSGMWTILQRKRAEQTLLRKHEELHTAYEEIYSADEDLRKNLDKITQQSYELEKREQQLHAIASNIPGVIFRLVVNPEGFYGFDYISERCYEILGIQNNPATFSEHVTANIIHEDREIFLNSIQEAIIEKAFWKFEGRYIKPSGELIWIKAVSRPIIEDGRYIFDGIIFDDTAWKHMDEFNRLLVNISDNAPASITVHDMDGIILYANDQAFRIHGYNREEFLAKNLHEIDVPESEELINKRMKRILETGIIEFNVYHYHKDGSRIPLHVYAKIIEWEGKKVILSIATVITERE